MKTIIAALSVALAVVFSFALLGMSQSNGSPITPPVQTFAGEGVPFTCGDTQLVQVDLASPEESPEGSTFAVIVTMKNVGTLPGLFSTNFLFRDPNQKIVDGSSGHNIYYLKPGQTHVIPWHHSFGCSNRPKGEYYLGIGTQTWNSTNACNYTYHEVNLINDTLCAGFNP